MSPRPSPRSRLRSRCPRPGRSPSRCCTSTACHPGSPACTPIELVLLSIADEAQRHARSERRHRGPGRDPGRGPEGRASAPPVSPAPEARARRPPDDRLLFLDLNESVLLALTNDHVRAQRLASGENEPQVILPGIDVDRPAVEAVGERIVPREDLGAAHVAAGLVEHREDDRGDRPPDRLEELGAFLPQLVRAGLVGPARREELAGQAQVARLRFALTGRMGANARLRVRCRRARADAHTPGKKAPGAPARGIPRCDDG